MFSVVVVRVEQEIPARRLLAYIFSRSPLGMSVHI